MSEPNRAHYMTNISSGALVMEIRLWEAKPLAKRLRIEATVASSQAASEVLPALAYLQLVYHFNEFGTLGTLGAPESTFFYILKFAYLT